MLAVPPASIVIPTRGRPGYLDWSLASIAPQAARAGAEVIVVADGPDPATGEVARRHGAQYESLPEPQGANAARNAGIARATAPLVVLVDDDIEAPPGWLDALLAGARSNPDHEVFGGPIRPRLLGGGPRACGREPAPITSLDYGSDERDIPLAWSANMAVRRSALDRVGPFDETIRGRGEEEDWERRYTAAGGRVRYLPGAGLDHLRTAADARVHRMALAAYRLGRTGRCYDRRKGEVPSVRAELRTLAGCVWHTVWRRCAYGIVMVVHSLGRLREALVEGPHSPGAVDEDFMSGTSGQVWGIRATARAVVQDAAADAYAALTARGRRLRRAAARGPRRRVLVVAVERDDQPNLLEATRTELLRSRHDVEFVARPVAGLGKWENVGLLLAEQSPEGFDWLFVVDDDVRLPNRFLDTFLFLADRFSLTIAQPAHRARSHAAWAVTRRDWRSVVRQTRFVEGGPLVAFHARTFSELLPFPPLRAGWGLDAHWSAIARDRGWPIGVIDATPIRHGLRRIAAAYDRSEAIAEGRRFLDGKPYIRASEAQRTVVRYRTW